MNSPTAQPARATVMASHPALRRPREWRAALAGTPDRERQTDQRHNLVDRPSCVGAVPPEQPTKLRPVPLPEPYPPTTEQLMPMVSPESGHGSPVQRFILRSSRAHVYVGEKLGSFTARPYRINRWARSAVPAVC